MTNTPHFSHPLQNAAGDLVLGSQVRVLDPDTMEPILQTVYADADLTEGQPQPFEAANGVVDFYLERPRIVTVEVTSAENVVTIFENRPVGFPHWETHTFTLAGQAGVSVGTLRYYIEQDSHIETVRVSAGLAPTGGPLVMDINRDGTTIFTTQANRPTLVAGANTVLATPDIVDLPAGSYLTLDVDQVGSTYPGGQIVVQIRTGRS